MAESPLPPMPMKWMCVMFPYLESVGLPTGRSKLLHSRVLDINHNHEHKREDDRKVNARLAKQCRRHVEHHLVDRL